MFTKAVKYQSFLKMSLSGVAGSGKASVSIHKGRKKSTVSRCLMVHQLNVVMTICGGRKRALIVILRSKELAL